LVYVLLHRALIEVYNIKPINTSPHALGVKRTAGFVRACSEMARHQELVQRAAQTKFEKSTGLHSDSDEKEEQREDDVDTEHNGSNKVEKRFVLLFDFCLCTLNVQSSFSSLHLSHDPCDLNLKPSELPRRFEDDKPLLNSYKPLTISNVLIIGFLKRLTLSFDSKCSERLFHSSTTLFEKHNLPITVLKRQLK